LKNHHILTFALLLFIPTLALGQKKWSYGGTLDYNFSTKGIGLGGRASYKFANRFSINPQIQYFPPFNSIHETYLGANVHYSFIKSESEHPDTHVNKPSDTKLEWYALAGGAFNYWFNASAFPRGNRNSIIPVVGLGLAKGKPEKRYFIEAKYNFLWKEPIVSIGLMLSPKKDSNSSNPCFNN
jgi:hypothetical protein